MTMLDFPAVPTVGETFQDWIWDGTKWTGTLPVGPPGESAFSTTTTPFTVPQVGSPVSVSVLDTDWAQPGMCVFIAGMVAMVQTVVGLELTLIRLQDNLSPDTIVNTVIPVGSLVSPAGFPGPIGPQGGPGQLLTMQPSVPTASALPLTGNCPGDARITIDTGHLWVWDGGNAWMDLGVISEGPAGPAGPQGPVGPPGPGGSSETTPWTSIAVDPTGWNALGSTVACRTALNGQVLQFRGTATAISPVTNQSTLGFLPPGIQAPIENRFVSIICGTAASPGYMTGVMAIVTSGSIVIFPPYGAPTQGLNSIWLSCDIPMDIGPVRQ